MAAILICFDSSDHELTVTQFDSIDVARKEMKQQYEDTLKEFFDDEPDPECYIDESDAYVHDDYELNKTWEIFDSRTYRTCL